MSLKSWYKEQKEEYRENSITQVSKELSVYRGILYESATFPDYIRYVRRDNYIQHLRTDIAKRELELRRLIRKTKV